MDDLQVGTGTVRVELCTDIYSQIRRFSAKTHCASGGSVTIPTGALVRRSGPVPNTVVKTRPSGVSASSTAVFRFVSTVAHSLSECRLDGGPWLVCKSPRRYTALVDGRHVLTVRAVSPSGRRDPTPARVAWTVDTVAPKITLQSPANGSTTGDEEPAFSGTAGTAATDAPKVTVKVFSGARASGLPVETLGTTVSRGSRTWLVAGARTLANGTYTARAQQSDRAGNTGLSKPSTFTISAATPPPPPPPSLSTFSIGGSVSGLSDGTVVLENNGGDDVSVSANGLFGFGKHEVAGAGYDVRVKMHPDGQQCTVSNGTGTVGSANVTGIAVSCTPLTFSIGGTVSGLADGDKVVLQDNGGDDLTVGTNASFTFGTRVAHGSGYDVTVKTSPDGEQCTVSDDTGTGTVGSMDVTSVVVTCTPQTFKIGGSVSGLSDGTLVLQDNGADDLSVTSDGTFTFATQVPHGRSYGVTVGGQPDGQQCTVTNGTGTVAAADVTNVAVSCVPLTFTIGGTVSGLDGTLVLDNGSDTVNVSASGAFVFATPVAHGGSYDVTVGTQPDGQQCAATTARGRWKRRTSRTSR